MSIGETLAQARRGAGLTVTQVSQRTRIREIIISGIERGDYSGCGADVYARGHIRAIARAVGADPGPLIAEYDASYRNPDPAADIFGPAQPIRLRGRRPVNWAAVLGLALAAALSLAAYHAISGPRHPAALPTARPGPATHRHTGRATAIPTGAPASAPYARTVVIRLTATGDCWIEFTTPGGRYLSQAYVTGGTSKTWSFRHAVAMRLGNPGGIQLTVDGRNPLPAGTGGPVTLRLGLNGRISS